MNHAISLWDEDEAAYALFGKRMLETGDWVTPDFTWSDIHRKTPFHFWAIAISYSIFGINEFALRLPSALAIALAGVCLYFWTRKRLGSDWSLLSLWIFSSTLFVPNLGKVALTDGWLLFFSTTAMLALFNYMYEATWRWNVLFWASLGAGVVVKGPPILMLAGGVWLGLFALHPHRWTLLRWHSFAAAPLALLPFGVWAWASYERDGGTFLLFLYDWYVAKRVGGSVLGQTGLPGYHAVVLSVSFLAWLPLLWWSWSRAKHYWQEYRAEALFSLAWIAMGWWFYELMTSKLPSYSLAAQPVLAIWAARAGLDWWQGRVRMPMGMRVVVGLYVGIWAAVCVVLMLGGHIFPHFLDLSHLDAGIVAQLYQNLKLIGLFIGICLYMLWKRRDEVRVVVGTMGFLAIGFQLSAWVGIVPLMEQTPLKSLKPIALDAARLQTSAHIAMPVQLVGVHVKQTKPSLLFYLVQHANLQQGLNFAETSVDTALQLVRGAEAAVFIVGEAEEAAALRSDTIAHYKATRYEWFSTDDQLRSHPFWIGIYQPK